MRQIFFAAVLGLAAFLFGTPGAQALTYQNGDLFLGVRASGGDGATQDYLVNIGPASQFTSASGVVTVPGLGSFASDLTAIFGSGWSSRSDVYWSISGGNLAADPEATLYVTRAAPAVGVQPLPFQGNSQSAQGVTLSKFNGLAGAYAIGTAASGSAVSTVQNTADSNSYASYQPGGTVQNSNGQSFAAFSPSIEASFADGADASVLDFIRVVPVYQQYGKDLGTFKLSNAGALTFTPAPTVATVGFESSTVSVDEDSGAARAFLTLRRGGNISTAFTINVSTANGTAAAPADYTAQSNVQVSFAAFQSSATVEVPIVLRSGVQGNRSFAVSLTSPSGGTTLGTPASATVTIVESETLGGKLDFAVNSYQKTEGAAADVALTISVTRSSGQTGAASVTVAATGGTATSGADYTLPTPVTLSWADGETGAKTFDVTIKKDDLNEDPESVVLSLQNPTVAVLGRITSTTVSIIDGTPIHAGTVSFDLASYAKTESPTTNATLTISATRTSGKTNAVTVQVNQTAGTATAGTDYTLPSPAQFSWAAGEDGTKTLLVTVKPDVLHEGDETATLTLQSPTGTLAIGTQASTVLTISDAPDSVDPTLTLLTPKANAKVSGASVTFTGVAKDDQSVGRVEISVNGGTPISTVPAVPTASFNYSLTVVPEQGRNDVVVTAFDASGRPSAAITRSITFTNVRPLLAGGYTGLLVAASDPLKNDGLVAVTVGATGAFSGKVTLSGVAIPIKGTFGTAGPAIFTATKTAALPLTKKVGKSVTALGQLALTLDTGAGLKITGLLKSDAAVTLASTTAKLGIYTSKKNPVLPLQSVPVTLLNPASDKGKYTVILPAHSGVNNGVPASGYPQGDGYASLTVSKAGVAKIVGKLADGTTLSFANLITAGNHVPLFSVLYGKLGFVTGDVAFDPTQSQTDASSTIAWFKPAATSAKDLNYPAGWKDGINVDLVASKYVAPVKPTTKVPAPPNKDTVLGAGATAATTPADANIFVTLADGGLPTSTSDDASLSAASKVTIISNPSQAKTLKVAFAAGSGALSGSFIHPGTSKNVKFAGIAYQKTHTASGFFLYLPPATQAGATIVSGAAGVGLK